MNTEQEKQVDWLKEGLEAGHITIIDSNLEGCVYD